MSDELTPITRKETFLAKAGGQNVVTPTPITREETFLQAIINSGGGGGGSSELPEVTAEDNGDVLTVVNGKWDKASGGGTGGGVLVVGMNTEIEGALNKTWKEIHDAAQEQAVVLSFPGSEGIIIQALLYQVYEYDGDYCVEFFTNTTLPVFSTNNENGYPVAQG